MSQFTSSITKLEANVTLMLEKKQQIEVKSKALETLSKKHVDMLEALSLLSTVSDDNTTAVLDYMTGVINRTLAELFPYDTRRVYLKKSLYRNKYTHINIVLEDGQGHARSLTVQSGTGIRQIIAYLYTISLIEVRKGRLFIVSDEVMSGVHPEAKRVMAEIMKLFAEAGFQMVFVEYGIDNIGKIYLVEKPDAVATVTPLDSNVYKNEVFKFNPPDGFTMADDIESDEEIDVEGVDWIDRD